MLPVLRSSFIRRAMSSFWMSSLNSLLKLPTIVRTSGGSRPLAACASWLMLLPMRRSSANKAGCNSALAAEMTSSLPCVTSRSHSPETERPADLALRASPA